MLWLWRLRCLVWAGFRAGSDGWFYWKMSIDEACFYHWALDCGCNPTPALTYSSSASGLMVLML